MTNMTNETPFPKYLLIERLTNEDNSNSPDIIEMVNDFDIAIINMIWYNSRGRDIEIYTLMDKLGVGWCKKKKGASACPPSPPAPSSIENKRAVLPAYGPYMKGKTTIQT